MAALGAGSWNVVLALTIVYTPSVARVVRSSALVTKAQTYVEAAKVQGATNRRILWKLILPSVISPLTVQASLSSPRPSSRRPLSAFWGPVSPPPPPAGATSSRPAGRSFPGRPGRCSFRGRRSCCASSA